MPVARGCTVSIPIRPYSRPLSIDRTKGSYTLASPLLLASMQGVLLLYYRPWLLTRPLRDLHPRFLALLPAGIEPASTE
jgi:hypothetical protein